MVEIIKRDEYDRYEFQGLSTDTKPMTINGTDEIDAGSTFYELDTRKGFNYSVKNINPVTGNGWWEV